jgi:predicted metal-binding protein
LLETFTDAVVLKIEVPVQALRSGRCEDFFRRLHRIAAQVERRAVALGWPQAQSFAGGSCKQLFCPEHSDCPVLTGSGSCRHPRSARASMSGYGIDVTRLMAAAGWTFCPVTSTPDSDEAPTGSICALVLVA